MERLLHEEADFQTPAHLVQGLKDLFPVDPAATRPAKPLEHVALNHEPARRYTANDASQCSPS